LFYACRCPEPREPVRSVPGGRQSAGGRAVAPIRLAGRHPRASAALAGLLFLAGAWTWWATQLWGLPDIGDPFDVAAFQAVRVPDERNAFLEYREAAMMLRAVGRNPSRDTYAREWSKAGQPWRDYLARVRPALDLWRAGTEKPDYLYEHPEGLNFSTTFPVIQQLPRLAQLAVLEGSRLEESGDVAGAWGWYRAALRSSRLAGRHGFLVERLIGAGMQEEAVKSLSRWATDPRVDASLLRRALGEVIAIDELTAPRSDAIKLEYLTTARSMGDPATLEGLLVSRMAGVPADWCQELPVPDAAKRSIQTARVVAADDRERSLRVLRLAVANWLPEIDKPPSRRAPLAHRDPPIYEGGHPAPPMSPEALAGWLDSSLLARRQIEFLAHWTGTLELERIRQAKLVVHLADQLYRREHGGPPPSPAELVGPYLKELPEGYDESP